MLDAVCSEHVGMCYIYHNGMTTRKRKPQHDREPCKRRVLE